MFKTIKLFLFVTLISIIACAPQTKEDYLKDYKAFIEDVKEDHNSYSKYQWEMKDREFKKYSNELYKQFEDDLTWKDRVKLEKYKIEYGICTAKKGIIDALNSEEANDIKKEIKKYKKDGLEDDLEFLRKQAEELGGETQKVLEEILEE